MAARELVGGDGCVRASEREEAEERDELEGVSERDQGLRGDARRPWRCGGSRRWPGKQEVAEAASAPVGHARCLVARGR